MTGAAPRGIAGLRAGQLAAAVVVVAGCADPRAAAPSRLPEAALAELARPLRVTVITFFSAECPCQRAHDARLRELYARYSPLGVDLVAVDAEAGTSPSRDEEERHARGFAFPIVSDPTGGLADALSAEFATYSLVVDGRGQIRYRGGLDSDKVHLTLGASMWVRDALDHLLAGRAPDPAETKTLGCSLRRR